jgi:hypothetical protein
MTTLALSWALTIKKMVSKSSLPEKFKEVKKFALKLSPIPTIIP